MGSTKSTQPNLPELSFMRVPPVQNIQDSTHTLTDSSALNKEEAAISNPVSANLRGVYQQLNLPTAPYQQNLPSNLVLESLEQTFSLTTATDQLNDAWIYKDRQGALAILLRQVRQILYEEDNSNPADKILEAYKYSMLIRKGDNVATKISSTALLEKVDELLTTQKSPHTFQSENNNNRPDFSWKSSTNLGIESLALFLEVTETQSQEHEFTKKFFLQRTFLEWTQLLYFSLLPTNINKKKLRDKRSKHGFLKRSHQDSESEQDEQI